MVSRYPLMLGRPVSSFKPVVQMLEAANVRVRSPLLMSPHPGSCVSCDPNLMMQTRPTRISAHTAHVASIFEIGSAG